ncbi:hypothetical protein J4558_14925 [Leptolyngbya sp. 15MV]|nr:hypothetical protein J4558_14925 [Leptolyngbya sp. 15MV]
MPASARATSPDDRPRVRQRAIAFEAGVEDLELASRAPAAFRRRAAQRIAASRRDPPDIAGKGRRLHGFEGIKDDPIMAPARHAQV